MLHCTWCTRMGVHHGVFSYVLLDDLPGWTLCCTHISYPLWVQWTGKNRVNPLTYVQLERDVIASLCIYTTYRVVGRAAALRPSWPVFRRLMFVAVIFSARRLPKISGPTPLFTTSKAGSLVCISGTARHNWNYPCLCPTARIHCLRAPIIRSGCISVLKLLLNGTYLVLMLWHFPQLAPSLPSHCNICPVVNWWNVCGLTSGSPSPVSSSDS
jgi:hypothetical protein